MSNGVEDCTPKHGLKVKCVKRQEFMVVEWRPPGYGSDDVRGLFPATYEDGQLVYRGSEGTGLTDRMRRQTPEALQLIWTDRRPAIRGVSRLRTMLPGRAP